MDVGLWPMTATSVEGEAPSTFYLMALTSLLKHRLAPGGACGSCTCGDKHVRVDEAELVDGGGKKVEGAERNTTSRSESLAAGERW